MSDLLDKVRSAADGPARLPEGAAILVAVSGGADSMALLGLLHRLAPERRWRLAAAHFNHQLRGAAADADERFVKRAARKLGIPVVAGRGSVRDHARKHGLSPEMAARELRHRFLARVARERKIRHIALGHHRDDQVELFFLRLMRGAGGEGLAGMKWRNRSPADGRVFLARPLLDCAKTELRRFVKTERIEFSEDATNASLDIPRNRVRRVLLPWLRKFHPSLDAAVARVMDIVGAEADAVGEIAACWLARVGDFDTLPVAVQRRAIQFQLFALGRSADFDLIERLRRRAGEPVVVAEGETLARDKSGRVQKKRIAEKAFQSGVRTVDLAARRIISFGGVDISWKTTRRDGARFAARPGVERFDADKVGRKIVLRHWRAGDRFRPIGAAATVKLQDLFTNAKVPAAERRRRALATTAAGDIFWVEGLRIGDTFKLTASTRRRLEWRFARRQGD